MGMPVHVPPPPAGSGRWTVTDRDRLPPDGRRHEIIHGELWMTPAPAPVHQRACAELYAVLRPYVADLRLGELFFSPIDLEIDESTVVQPDLVLFPRTDPLPPRWRLTHAPRLVIEILSRSTAHVDRQAKRLLYQRSGIPEYWIVDLDARVVERWRPHDERPEIATETLILDSPAHSRPFVLDVRALFRRVFGG